MELRTETKSGNAIRLIIDRDKHGVHQVYAYRFPHGGSVAERYLCNGWGVRKTRNGMIEGVQAEGQILEIPKSDWLTIAGVREDLRDRENLADIHLVKIFSQGDQLTIDAYTLSARVDRATWSQIESYMRFVDSALNDVLYAGDRFVGWVVKEGREEEVERILGIKPEHSFRTRTGVGG